MDAIVLAFVLFFLFSIISLYSSKKTKILYRLYILSFFVLFLYAGFREVGADKDSIGYQNYYEAVDLASVEISFKVISLAVKAFFGDFRYLLLIYAAIGVYLKFKAIDLLSDFPWSALVIYFPSYYLLHEFTQIRAGIASGLFLLSIPCIVRKDKLLYFTIITIAVLFHASAIVLYPLYLLNNNKINTKHIIRLLILFFIAAVIQFLGIDVVKAFLYLFDAILPVLVHTKMQSYIEGQYYASTSLNVLNLIYMYKYILLLFLFFYRKYFQDKDEKFVLLLKIYFLSLFSYLTLSSYTIFAMRISELLGIVEIILVPYVCYFFRLKKVDEFYAKFLIIIIGFSYLLVSIYHARLVLS